MAKKDLKNVHTDLASLAGPLPTQHVGASQRVATATPTAPKAREPEAQFPFSRPKSVKKELRLRALAEDMTIRGFILKALQAQGISISDDVTADARKKD